MMEKLDQNPRHKHDKNDGENRRKNSTKNMIKMMVNANEKKEDGKRKKSTK